DPDRALRVEVEEVVRGVEAPDDPDRLARARELPLEVARLLLERGEVGHAGGERPVEVDRLAERARRVVPEPEARAPPPEAHVVARLVRVHGEAPHLAADLRVLRPRGAPLGL